MGEKKRREAKMSPAEKAAAAMTHKLANDGNLIEGGFAAFMLAEKISIDHPVMPLLLHAYMAGAEHLWSSIMVMLDPGTTETEADMRRFALIQKELDRWREAKLSAYASAVKTEGNA